MKIDAMNKRWQIPDKPSIHSRRTEDSYSMSLQFYDFLSTHIIFMLLIFVNDIMLHSGFRIRKVT